MLNSILVTQNDSLSDFKEDCILVVFFLLFFDALKLILCYGLAYISMYSRPSESTWRNKNGRDENLRALHEWLIHFHPLSFYGFVFISLHLRCRTTSFSKYQTPRNIQALSNRCNLPKAAHTHTHEHIHTLLPLYAPPASLSPVTAKSRPQSLLLPARLCLRALCVLLGWLQTPAVCLSSGQAQTHLPSSPCSRLWLSGTCQPSKTLCWIGERLHTQIYPGNKNSWRNIKTFSEMFRKLHAEYPAHTEDYFSMLLFASAKHYILLLLLCL